MAKILVDTSRCKGCYLCVGICPRKAITIRHEVNEKGYRPITVSEELCVGCGSCYQICPDYVFEIGKKEKDA